VAAAAPGLFKDSEISNADAARYSLILIGAPRRTWWPTAWRTGAAGGGWGPREDRRRSFAASDARVQMIYPNPLNAQRYVLEVRRPPPAACTSGTRTACATRNSISPSKTGTWRGATGARRHRDVGGRRAGSIGTGRSRMGWWSRATPKPEQEQLCCPPRPTAHRSEDPGFRGRLPINVWPVIKVQVTGTIDGPVLASNRR